MGTTSERHHPQRQGQQLLRQLFAATGGRHGRPRVEREVCEDLLRL